ncbi:helix-turn-helix domain-containing protein [Siphonobacter sp. BAB-5405]|uniref:helix-turn-helix domain-containing protein n=1 Tax=Siphonobacter sp. BAB-5405 TaxID=1864825 RepID=UPI001304FE2B|nr:helix-turn-helix domain-containing protein [Siphonobacter sp. BAB-5405]
MSVNPFEILEQKIDNLALLIMTKSAAPVEEEDKMLNLEEAAAYLGMVQQTIRRNIRKIPHRKRHGRLFFFKSELVQYVKNGK